MGPMCRRRLCYHLNLSQVSGLTKFLPPFSILFSYRGTDDKTCRLYVVPVSSSQPSDNASWYEMWEAASAIWSVCTRHGVGGSVNGIGEFHASSAVK